jgi:hypothetical protein
VFVCNGKRLFLTRIAKIYVSGPSKSHVDNVCKYSDICVGVVAASHAYSGNSSIKKHALHMYSTYGTNISVLTYQNPLDRRKPTVYYNTSRSPQGKNIQAFSHAFLKY